MTKIARKLLSALECNNAELSLLLTTDEEIQQLNLKYRGKDSATDVLSFPMEDKVGRHGQELLGDVVISLETANKQANELGVSFREELLRLLIHGVLHLLGYDHETSEAEKIKMEAREQQLFDQTIELFN